MHDKLSKNVSGHMAIVVCIQIRTLYNCFIRDCVIYTNGHCVRIFARYFGLRYFVWKFRHHQPTVKYRRTQSGSPLNFPPSRDSVYTSTSNRDEANSPKKSAHYELITLEMSTMLSLQIINADSNDEPRLS